GTLRLLGQVAQLVEQRTENPRVGGSIPSLAMRPSRRNARTDQMVTPVVTSVAPSSPSVDGPRRSRPPSESDADGARAWPAAAAIAMCVALSVALVIL